MRCTADQRLQRSISVTDALYAFFSRLEAERDTGAARHGPHARAVKTSHCRKSRGFRPHAHAHYRATLYNAASDIQCTLISVEWIETGCRQILITICLHCYGSQQSAKNNQHLSKHLLEKQICTIYKWM